MRSAFCILCSPCGGLDAVSAVTDSSVTVLVLCGQQHWLRCAAGYTSLVVAPTLGRHWFALAGRHGVDEYVVCTWHLRLARLQVRVVMCVVVCAAVGGDDDDAG